MHSVLDEIRGVGDKTKQLLLKEFKSLKRIKEASLPQLTAVVGTVKANIVYNALNINEKDNNIEQ